MNGIAFSRWQIILTISKISLCTVYAAVAAAAIAAAAIWRSTKRENNNEKI